MDNLLYDESIFYMNQENIEIDLVQTELSHTSKIETFPDIDGKNPFCQLSIGVPEVPECADNYFSVCFSQDKISVRPEIPDKNMSTNRT